MNDEDVAQSLLARLMYQHFCEHRDQEPKPGLFAPEWAWDYARIAVTYLGVDQAALDDMKEDLR